MAQEYFLRVPTILGLQGSVEILPQPLGATATPATDKRVTFVMKYYETAVKVAKLFNIHPLIILAQGSVESGWGTSKFATEDNNFFGITAFGSPNKYWTGEKRISTSSGIAFRHYKTVEACFSDYARIITSYYKEAAAVSNNINEYAQKIAYSKYLNASDANRAKYKALIIASAATILSIAKKKIQSLFN
jgi:flagellar protein FlgJ